MDSFLPPGRPRDRRCGIRHSSAALSIIASCALAALLVHVPGAHADQAGVAELEALAVKAMESYDMLDYEAAKKRLNAAVTRAKERGLEQEPALARVYMSLGIVYFSGDGDPDGARAAFVDAVKVDPAITISPAYRTAAMEALLEQVRAEVTSAAASAAAAPPGGVDCAAIEGVSHTLIDSAPAGDDVLVEAMVGSAVGAAKVMLYFRQHGAAGASSEYTGVVMSQSDGCTFRGSIPGGLVHGGVLHYYIEAEDAAGKRVASKGASGSPNIIEITGAAAEVGEDENPLGSGAGGAAGSGPRFFVALAGGTGGAYVAGETEQLRSPVNCCIAPALVHLLPEVGYYLSRRTSLSVAARIGFPVGANIMRHATAAPAGVVRLRYALSPSGQGMHVTGAVGGGVIRQTVKLNMPLDSTMDTDTTAIGPLLVGGGIGYSKALSKTVHLTAELNTTIGLPMVDTIGTAVLSFGIHVDANIGLLLAF